MADKENSIITGLASGTGLTGVAAHATGVGSSAVDSLADAGSTSSTGVVGTVASNESVASGLASGTGLAGVAAHATGVGSSVVDAAGYSSFGLAGTAAEALGIGSNSESSSTSEDSSNQNSNLSSVSSNNSVGNQSSSTGNRKLDTAIEELLKNLNSSINEISKNKFVYANFMDKCKNISYQKSAMIGVNFYVYKWFSSSEVKENANLTTDVGCDNYKDIDLTNIKETSFDKNGGDIYIKEAEKINSFQAELAKEINRIVSGYDEFCTDLDQISSELSEINIPKVDLSRDFADYKQGFKTITTALESLIDGEVK